jgi:hypothetical protein
MWGLILGGWIRENAQGGFRWHVSGDIFSLEYAEWIAAVCMEAPEVRFWIYTRSFDDGSLLPLMDVSTCCGGNLAINLSCDRDNYELAKEVRDDWSHWVEFEVGVTPEHHEGPRLCYLTLDGMVPGDLPPGSVIFPDYQIRPKQFTTMSESPWWATLNTDQKAMVCPVDAWGKSEKNRCGPCRKCLE